MNSSLVRSLHRASQRARILSFSTKTRNPKTPKPILDAATKSAWKRPSEIPFQSKVANSVSLIGYVHSPVQFQTSSDGSPWAATVISQGISVSNDGDDRESPESLPLWVPVIFEGDLAHIAASYLKRNDRVYVSGLLSSSLPQIEGSKVQASIQVMVNDFNFVEEGTQKQKFSDASNEWERETSNNSGFSSTDKELLWKDLIENSPQWWDNREAKENCTVSPKYPDFKHKESGQVLWLSGAPISIVKSLQGLEFSVPIHKPKEMKQSKDSEDPILASWEDLIERSTEWRDFRNSKVNGEVSAKHPDFKRKGNTSSALWLNSAPKWILPQLEGLEFDVSCPQIKKSDQAPNADELWTDLVENFGDWWDNRVNKFNVRAPDFKHKKTGAALWLSSLPDWVSSKLPPPKIPFTESDNIL